MDTREKIGLKALNLFLENGYDNTSMSHIAKEIGLSKAGLYHHYSSKEALLFHVIDYMMEKNFIPLLEEAQAIRDPQERLIFFLRGYTRLLARDPTPRVVIHEAKRLKRQRYKKVQRIWQIAYELIKNAISEMQLAGKAKNVNTAFATFAAVGMCNWIFYWFDYSRKENTEELADTIVDIFLKGIRNEN